MKTEIRKIIDNLVGKVSGADEKRNPFEPNRVLYIALLASGEIDHSASGWNDHSPPD